MHNETGLRGWHWLPRRLRLYLKSAPLFASGTTRRSLPCLVPSSELSTTGETRVASPAGNAAPGYRLAFCRQNQRLNPVSQKNSTLDNWLALAVALAATCPAHAQSFPTKPIRILTSEPGGGTDFVARMVAQGLSDSFGQPVIVENRGGGSGVIAGEVLAKAVPDGHTLLAYGSTIWIVPLMRQNIAYDPQRDFQAITLTDRAPNVLAVHPTLAASSIGDVIALARARPGELNYARAAAGGPPHLSAELFKSMTKTQITAVPYKGGGPAVIGLLGGQVQLMFATAASITPHIKSGKARALAVTSATPSTLFPGVPTVAASVPGYEAVALNGVFAPAGTPTAIANRLSGEIAKFLQRAEVRERFLATGVETVGSTPVEFTATVKSEITKWGKLIHEAGIRDE